MKYTIDKQERFALMEIQEEKLDSRTAPALKGEFVLLGNEGFRNIVVNLGHVQLADSSGLSALLVGNRICQQNEGQFVLCCLGPHLQKLIDISQLNTVLNILPTQEEAVEAVMLGDLELELEDEMRVIDGNGSRDEDLEEEEEVLLVAGDDDDWSSEEEDDLDFDEDDEDWEDDDDLPEEGDEDAWDDDDVAAEDDFDDDWDDEEEDVVDDDF
ncbi:MAG: STAS domain-containing protein [Bacteroidetes bacterium]|nr:STAS domain-containing protein [Bacteroidota bacterium]